MNKHCSRIALNSLIIVYNGNNIPILQGGKCCDFSCCILSLASSGLRERQAGFRQSWSRPQLTSAVCKVRYPGSYWSAMVSSAFIFPSISCSCDELCLVRCPRYCNFLVLKCRSFSACSNPSQYFLVGNLIHPGFDPSTAILKIGQSLHIASVRIVYTPTGSKL